MAKVYFLPLISCCQVDRPQVSTPTYCFEQNGCYGLLWLGRGMCSRELVNGVARSLQNTIDTYDTYDTYDTLE